MNYSSQQLIYVRRATLALSLVLIAFAGLIVRLAFLQIEQHDKYAHLANNNSISIIPIPPNRGLIYDRHGRLLAQNIPSFRLEIMPEQVPVSLTDTIEKLSKILTISEHDITEFHKTLARQRKFLGVPIRYQLTEAELAVFATNKYQFPEVNIQANLVRYYPYKEYYVHSLGYIGRINEDEVNSVDETNYSATQYIGKVGIEKFYEPILHGTVGYQEVEMNAGGRVVRVLKEVPPVGGQDLYLTLDHHLQQVAYDSLQNKRGAIVALNPRSGEILALVSHPGYDPNLFIYGIKQAVYDELHNSLDRPLFNRAIRGQYPPASTIKPVVAIAGLMYKIANPNYTIYDPGWYKLPGDTRKYRDWKEFGHGYVNLQQALVQSCDVYFYELAHKIGIERLASTYNMFGLGNLTEIDMGEELPGLVPNAKWKYIHRKQAWFPGETLSAGIGQGFVLATPLQLAAMSGIIATKGDVYQPHVLLASKTPDRKINYNKVVLKEHLDVSDNIWNFIHQAMLDVVNSSRGTASQLQHGLTYSLAGKSGTAQLFGLKQHEKYDIHVTERLRDHTLFIAFAPEEDPKIAVAVIIENGAGIHPKGSDLAKVVIDAFMQQTDSKETIS